LKSHPPGRLKKRRTATSLVTEKFPSLSVADSY
jgi:Holliday junction DNA helicase RuvB